MNSSASFVLKICIICIYYSRLWKRHHFTTVEFSFVFFAVLNTLTHIFHSSVTQTSVNHRRSVMSSTQSTEMSNSDQLRHMTPWQPSNPKSLKAASSVCVCGGGRRHQSTLLNQLVQSFLLMIPFQFLHQGCHLTLPLFTGEQ